MLGRRLIAIVVDWASCLLISFAFFDTDRWVTLGLFALVQVITVGTVGSSPGHRLAGLRVTRTGGAWAGPWRAAVRTLLLCLVVPAVISVNGRGLHDAAAGTVIGPLTGTPAPTR